MVQEETDQILQLMTMVFPGYKSFKEDQVIPSIYGAEEQPIVSFMVVCNDEAAAFFAAYEELRVGLQAGVRRETDYPDVYIQLEFELEDNVIQFFTIAEGGPEGRERRFAQKLAAVNSILLWLVDKDKNLIKIMQAPWEWREQAPALEELLF